MSEKLKEAGKRVVVAFDGLCCEDCGSMREEPNRETYPDPPPAAAPDHDDDTCWTPTMDYCDTCRPWWEALNALDAALSEDSHE